MILRSHLLLSFVLVLLTSVASAEPDKVITGAGVATESEPGLIYIEGSEYKIVRVQTDNGKVAHISVPNMGATQVTPSEHIVYAGPILRIGDINVVNTSLGFVYRATAKTMQEEVQENMMKQMSLIQKQMASPPPNSLPNAVPITVLQTNEQKKESLQREIEAKKESRLNMWLTIISILVGILAIEKVLRGLQIFIEWVLRKLRRPKGDDAVAS
jgi:hypothetical protein